MKKITTVALILIAAVLLWTYSFRAGVRHAIEDSEIWTVTCYNPENPEESAWDDYDQVVFIDLDGNLYVHSMYQG